MNLEKEKIMGNECFLIGDLNMAIQINGIKNEAKIADKINIKNKKNKKVLKPKKNSKVEDNSHTIVADVVNNNITNTYNVYLTNEQVDNFLGVAKNDILDEFKDKLKMVPKKNLKQALKQITPLFIATYLNKQSINEQKAILINIKGDETIRRQAFQKINLITQQDKDLLIILKKFSTLANILNYNFPYNNMKTIMKYDDFKQERTPIINNILNSIKNIILEIEDLQNKYITQYGKFLYKSFENLLINSLVFNDNIISMPLIELACKLFMDFIDDQTKNAEYYNDDKRDVENRSKWTSWFTQNKYSNENVKKILENIIQIINNLPQSLLYQKNWNGNLFWHISNVGEEIIRSIFNS